MHSRAGGLACRSLLVANAAKNNNALGGAPSVMIRTLLLASFCLAASAAMAQVPPDIAAKNREIGKVVDTVKSAAIYGPLQPKEPYGVPGLQITRDIAYGPGPLEKLDVFTTGGSGKPVLIFLHGGGFVGGDKAPVTNGVRSPFYDNIMLWAVQHGMVGVNLNYDLAPKALYPTVQSSISTAISWAQQSAARFGGDPNRIYLMGHSAGGTHVAAYLANREFYPRGGVGIRGAIVSSGPFDATSAPNNVYFLPKERFGQLDFAEGALGSGVPLLVFEAEYDPDFVPNGLRHLKALVANQPGKARIVLNKGHGHMSESYSIGTADQSVSGEIEAFIKAHP
jgi:triacylglycerol lipase